MKTSNKHSLWAVVLAVMLIGVMMLALSACNQDEQTNHNTTAPTTEPTTEPTVDNIVEYPTIKGDMLSWDYLNSVPIKTANMDIREARQLCVDFYRVSKSALWIPDTNYKVYDKNGKLIRSMKGGQIYAGLPYIPSARGNIYRLMDYMDPETGIVDVTAAGKKQEFFGNQCSCSSYWGWARVINSAKFSWTEDMLMVNGFLRLGTYTYDDAMRSLGSSNRTTQILSANGTETMYQSYAELKAGDGIVYYTTGGHVAMIAQDAYVVKKADGSIDPQKSYVMVIDQAGTWKEATNPQGDTYTYSANNDVKWTFDYLYTHDYMPFTFAEWLGTDPIEETEISYSHTADTISLDELYRSKATCNYGFSDLYAIVKDSDGNEVYKLAVRPNFVNLKTMFFVRNADVNVEWGSAENLDKNKEYTVEIIAQIATGERPTLWTGKLAQ